MSPRRPLLVFLTALGAALCMEVRGAAADLTDMVAQADKAMGRIIVSDGANLGSGSGFVIGRDGNGNPVFLTNFHVAGGGSKIVVIFRDGPSELASFTGQVIAASRDLDMAALVLFPQEAGVFFPSELALSVREPIKGETVASLGYPATSDDVVADSENIALFETTLTQGLVSKVFVSTWRDPGATEEVEIVQHTATINRGNSGGPLLDECGQPVGMNTAGLLDGGGVFLASSARSIAAFLDGAGVAYSSSTQKCGPITEPSFTTEPVAADPDAAAVPDRQMSEPLMPVFLREAIWQNLLLAAGIMLGLGFVIGLIALITSQSAPAVAKSGAPAVVLSMRAATGWTLTRPVSADALARGVVFGRGDGADINVDLVGISRQHARIWVQGRKLMLADLGSRNGTTVDGVPLQKDLPRQVNSGSAVVLAGIVTLLIGRTG